MPVEWRLGALSHGGNWALQTDHGRVDILQCIEGADVVETYTELREQALEACVPDVGAVRFASLEHLELMKKVAGRPQDINDLAQLADIRSSGA